jgi:hypothetical protein
MSGLRNTAGSMIAMLLILFTFTGVCDAKENIDLNGTWNTKTSQGADYVLTLRVDGDNVSGSFVNKIAGQYNGTLHGTATGGVLKYKYFQPKIGNGYQGEGFGTFMVSNGSLIGTGSARRLKQAPLGAVPEGGYTDFSWNGTRTDSTAGIDISPSAFGGVWRVYTSQNASFDVTLFVVGDSVKGEFINLQNREYNGTLTGTVGAGSRLRLTWIQPASGATGGGALWVHTDGTMGGGIDYKASGPDKMGTYIHWYGTRTGLKITPGGGASAGTSPPAGSTAVNYPNLVLQYAISHIGQRLGRGECTDLVTAALAAAGARPGDTSSADGHYVWGRKINFPTEAAMPGDIIQLVKVTLSYKTANSSGSWSTSTQHSAIIESASGKLLHVIQQNAPTGSAVGRGDIDLNWTLVSGDYAIYRPLAP